MKPYLAKMTAEIISVGDELLAGLIADTNAKAIGELLPQLGIEHRHRQTVGDDVDAIAGAVRLALSRADFVFTIGGLGPTEDDRTREGIAQALDLSLELDPKIEERLRKLFALRNLPWTPMQLRQAMRPADSIVLENPNGSAPGLVMSDSSNRTIRATEQSNNSSDSTNPNKSEPSRTNPNTPNRKSIIALPGPRGEFLPMLEGPVVDFLKTLPSEGVITAKILRTAGIGESMLEQLLGDLMRSENPTIAPYASPGEVKLRIVARSKDEHTARTMLAEFESKVRTIIDEHIFGEDKTELEAAILQILRERSQTLATAESMTGGGLAARLTSVAGASDVFLGGIIPYQGATKAALAGIEDVDDPVSEEVAVTLACSVTSCGVQRAAYNGNGGQHPTASGTPYAASALAATYGIGITGNAGPTSDRGGKPVGLVCIALSGPILDGRECGARTAPPPQGASEITEPQPNPTRTLVERHQFAGSRENIRKRAVQAALIMLWRALRERP